MALQNTNFLVQLGTPLGTTKMSMKITRSLALENPGRLWWFTVEACKKIPQNTVIFQPPRSGSMPNLAKCWLEIVTWKQEMRHWENPGIQQKSFTDQVMVLVPILPCDIPWHGEPLCLMQTTKEAKLEFQQSKLIPFFEKRMPGDTKGQGPLMWY